MADDDVQLLSFNEDEFDMEAHKNAASAHTREVYRARRTGRQLSFLKILIMILAFVMMFSLYYFISDLILQHDYNKYHSTYIIE